MPDSASVRASAKSRIKSSARKPSNLMKTVVNSMPMALLHRDIAYRKVLQGHMETLPPVNTKVIRIFLSSTFSDMACERNILMREVYPRLKDYCRDKHGMEFQVIDMRWGVRSESQIDHRGPDLCYQEVLNSQAISMGPSFIVILGQRYGGQPPPSSILCREFHLIKDALHAEGLSTDILEEWYRRDENNIPPVYVLRPILENVNTDDMEFEEKLQKAKLIWFEAERKILKLIEVALKLLQEKNCLDEKVVKALGASVTENEVRLGILNSTSKKYAIAFIRDIVDLPKSLDHPKINKFLDIVEVVHEGKVENAVDETLKMCMDELKERQILENLPDQNISKYSMEWKQKGIDYASHSEDLNNFAEVFFRKTKNVIDKSIDERSKFSNDDVYVEVLQHSDTCVRYVRQFQGRREIIDRIKEYVQGDCTNPLVVHGASGSGKTSVLGKAACESINWLPNDCQETSLVVLRFLGTSPASSTIRNLLQSVCGQLAMFVDDKVDDVRTMEDLKQIILHFYSLLESLSATRHILLFLDSLDQLDSSSGAHHLTWLNKELPRNVKMIVSTLPNIFGLLDTLRGKLPNPDCYVEVKPLEQSLCNSILKSLLNERSRDLTEHQWRIVANAFRKCSLPIFVRLVFYQVLEWKSYQADALVIEDSVRGAIFQLFKNLELKYGRMLTSHALAYITASRNGLSESELEDLLSLDDDVLRDVFEYHLPPLIRIPPMCWARLRQDVGSYLVEREADDTRILYWYHRQFIEVAREYFLGNKEFKRMIHSRMADYFLGTWGGGRKKNFHFPEKLIRKLNLPPSRGEDRMVPLQPYVLESTGKTDRYNLRKVNELPWHLTYAGRIEEFYDYIVFNLQFLITKLKATSRYEVLRDIRLPAEVGIECIDEVNLVYNAIRLAALTLNKDPSNFVVDLPGRLLKYENDNARIHLLLDQCRNEGASYCCLLPTMQSFESGSDALSTSFDVGLSMGIVLANGLIAVISLVDTEVELYDVEGNPIKTFKFNHNIFLGMKYLFRLSPLGKVEYNLVVYGSQIANEEALMEEYRNEMAKRQEIENETNDGGGTSANDPPENADDVETENKESEEESEDDAAEDDEKKRPVDVISINFETGASKHLWRLRGKIRKNVTLDDTDFVGQRFFVTIPKSYKTRISVYDIQKKRLVLSQASVYLWSSDITNDEELVYWSKRHKAKEGTSCTFTVRHLESGAEYTHVSEMEETWQPLWVTYLKDEFCIFWVKDNEKRSPLLQVFDSRNLFSENSDKKFEKLFEEQLTPCDFWKPISDRQGVGNREMMRKHFVSPDFKYSIVTYNNKDHMPGFIWKRVERAWVKMDCSGLEYAQMKSCSKSWSDGTQAYFPKDKPFVFTSGSESLLLVWSMVNGRLIRVIKFGTAESLLGGELDGRFILFHFPDESQGDSEKMFIMAKFYNIDAICKEETSEEGGDEQILPIYQVKKSKNDTLLFNSSAQPHIIVHCNMDDSVIYDLESRKLLYRGSSTLTPEAEKDVPSCFVELLKSQLDFALIKPYERPSLGEETDTTESLLPTDEEKGLYRKRILITRFMKEEFEDSVVAAQYRSVSFWRDIWSSKNNFGYFDDEFNIAPVYGRNSRLISRQHWTSTGLYLLNSPRKWDVIKETLFIKPSFERSYYEKPINVDDNISFKVANVFKRPGHSGQTLVTSIKNEGWVNVTRADKEMYWHGHIDIVDFGSWLKTSDEDIKPFITYGPIFDCGSYILYFNDGEHVLNYRLHVYNFTTGQKMREIFTDNPDILFMNFLMSPDEEYLFAFAVRRPYKVEFEIEENFDDEDTFAEDSPRNVQVFRLSDSRMIANYIFEVDPSDMIIANHGKSLIIACHNKEGIIFDLKYPDQRPATTATVTRRPHTVSTSEKRCLSRGPKTSYLADLNLMPILSNALKEVVETRPGDPIKHLSELIRSHVIKNDTSVGEIVTK